jgi:hypothetical protein
MQEQERASEREMRRYGRVPDAGERSGSAAAALVGGYLLGRRGFLVLYGKKA